jgi:ADP-ribose pyrophosphatase YjhB (NUDIX family)
MLAAADRERDKMPLIGGFMRDAFPVVVHTLMWRRGALLLLRRAGTGYLDGWYALPGGHMQRGEGIVECAMREIREETGIVVEASQLRAAAVMPYLSGEHQGIDFIMACDDFVGEPTLAELQLADAIGFWSADALPANTVPYLRTALDLAASGEWFLEFRG